MYITFFAKHNTEKNIENTMFLIPLLQNFTQILRQGSIKLLKNNMGNDGMS